MQRSRPCRFFAKGKCHRGDKCSFAHETPDNNTAATEPINPYRNMLTRWRVQIPRDAREVAKSRPLGFGIERFVEQAFELVEAEAETMQEVITVLASEGGHHRLRELLDESRLACAEGIDLETLCRVRLIPYMQLLSHENVLASTVIEARHATLLASLYGVNGQRAVIVFGSLIRFLQDDEQFSKDADLVAPCIITLSLVMQTNASAKVNEELQTTAQAFVALAEQQPMTGTARQQLQRLRVLIGMGSGIPTAQPDKQIRSEMHSIIPSFSISQDMPGVLSTLGRRHDNDHEDIMDIRILPTMEEIQSNRNEYLPRDDPRDWHLNGIAGLIDRHFRLVREDTVGQLRDAAKHELHRLAFPGVTDAIDRQRARTNTYQNSNICALDFDEHTGLLLILSFDQPSQLRGKTKGQRKEWWEETNRLAPDALVVLLGSDGLAMFLTVAATTFPAGKDSGKASSTSKLQEKYSKFEDETTAYVVVQMTSSTTESTEELLARFTAPHSGFHTAQHSLLEFSGVLLPTFEPTLLALQQMAGTLDVPFADILAPDHTSDVAQAVIEPPAYAQRSGFKMALTSISKHRDPLFFEHEHPLAVEELEEHTTLDHAQAKAVIASLTRSLALVQGPPGTGKSYTGEALMKVLVGNKTEAKLGPILVVTFTNHALDQTLEKLVGAGVTQIIRIGSRSKSACLAPLNLRNVCDRAEHTKAERQQKWSAGRTRKTSTQAIHQLLIRLQAADSEDAIRAHLKPHNPMHYQQIFEPYVDEDGFQEVHSGRRPYGLMRWLRAGATRELIRPATTLQNIGDLTTLSHQERELLLQSWIAQIVEPIQADLVVELRVFEDVKSVFSEVKDELKLRVLREANVIGVTTTGLARNLQYLRKLNSKVLLVEEAGEVLEAHLLTAMLPSIEHVILIGDHQQLRPKVQNYDLSCENERSQISLDISLFERLVHPREGYHSVAYTTLEVQRRMHPSISNLIRSTLYPRLQDGPNVGSYAGVAGVRDRLHWLDHDHKEDAETDQTHTTSHSNSYEVGMVSSLVHHLVNQGVYRASDIAVLTPYLGQLRKLRHALKDFTEIVLNERDVEELRKEDEGEIDSSEEDMEKGLPPIARGTLLDAIRLATVDNFQGEEAKVVVISLVRCNEQRRCGFLRTSNRINVLLSRAQHGMYIVGNAATSAHVPMWQSVLDLLKKNNCIGDALDLCCPRHPETPIKVKTPEDFVRLAPEAGCDLMCGKRLPCGHACTNKCHSDPLHNAVYCLKPCRRPQKGCEHPCQRECGRECDERCHTAILGAVISLACGHRVQNPPCWQYQDLTAIKCRESVERKIPGCGHTVSLPCHIAIDDDFECRARCGAVLNCGHICTKLCMTCNHRESDTITKVDHGKCKHPCGRDFTTCKHSCKAECHGSDACPLCAAPCDVKCSHGRCNKKCNEPCAPCAEAKCSARCPHSTCSLPCAAPCDWIPCSRRCEKRLECGHQCPSICGSCPNDQQRFCQVCCPDEVKELCADLIMMTAYGDVDLDESPCIFTECGHVFTVETLDGFMSMADHYSLDANGMPDAPKGNSEPFSYKEMKMCPACRGSLRNVPRYGRIVRRALLDESTKKFITWSNAEYVSLAERLERQQVHLLSHYDHADMISGRIRIADGRDAQMRRLGKCSMYGRYDAILSLRQKINTFMRKVHVAEQPFQRVRDLVEASRHRQLPGPSMPSFTFEAKEILQTRGYLLASALLLRCEIVAVTDLITVWDKMLPNARKPELEVNFTAQRCDCESLIERAEKSKDILQQVEGHIFWAQYTAFEYDVRHSRAAKDEKMRHNLEFLKVTAQEHLKQAQEICDQFPAQTASIIKAGEVAEVTKMLLESGYHSEMRMIVEAMSTEFSGTGHWYRCQNGHPFTVGECGLPMETARCVQCNATIGGRSHQAVEGVAYAGDIEEHFAGLQV